MGSEKDEGGCTCTITSHERQESESCPVHGRPRAIQTGSQRSGQDRAGGLTQADLQAVMVVDRVTPVPNEASDRRIVRLTAMSVLGCPQGLELTVDGPAAVPFADALAAGTYLDVGVRLVVVPMGEAAAKDRAMTDAIRRRLDEHRELDVLRVEKAGELATECRRRAAYLEGMATGIKAHLTYSSIGELLDTAKQLREQCTRLDELLAGTVTP